MEEVGVLLLAIVFVAVIGALFVHVVDREWGPK